MRLYDLILQNKNLRFIDTISGKSTMVNKFHKSIKIENFHGLGFVYSTNQIDSIEVFLNFLESKFSISLLNAQLNIQFKQRLEDIYQPYYIYDSSRDEIKGYEKCSVSKSIDLFKRNTIQTNPINKNIKLLLSTSGTTGNSKFVKLSDNNLVKNAMSILDYMPIKNDDVVPLSIPITYVYGLSIFTTNCIKAGTIVCTDKDILQKGFWEDFKTYKFSTLSGVPYSYEMLYRIGFFKKEHEFLRYMTQAGGKLSKKMVSIIVEYSKKHKIPFYTQYGQTEAAGRLSFLHPNDLLNRGYSIGKPIKGGRFELKEGTNELIYYGDNVFGGYAQGLDDLVTFNESNKLFTGDIAKKDKDGYYYIVGRIKRIMKLFGTRINLDEVELILKNNLEGGTFICTGIEDKYLYVIHLNKELEHDSIKKVLREKLNLHSSSIKIKYVENIPLTTNGKIDYQRIKKFTE